MEKSSADVKYVIGYAISSCGIFLSILLRYSSALPASIATDVGTQLPHSKAYYLLNHLEVSSMTSPYHYVCPKLSYLLLLGLVIFLLLCGFQ